MQSSALEPILLTQEIAAKRLSISRKSVSRLIADGRLRAVPMGARRLIHRDELTRLAEQGVSGRIRE